MTPEELNALLKRDGFFERFPQIGSDDFIGLTDEQKKQWRLTIQALKMLDSREYSKGMGDAAKWTDDLGQASLPGQKLADGEAIREKTRRFNYAGQVSEEDVSTYFQQSVYRIIDAIPHDELELHLSSRNRDGFFDFAASVATFVADNMFTGYEVDNLGFKGDDPDAEIFIITDKHGVTIETEELTEIGSNPTIWWHKYGAREINRERKILDRDPSLYLNEDYMREGLLEAAESALFGENTEQIVDLLLLSPSDVFKMDDVARQRWNEAFVIYGSQLPFLIDTFNTGAVDIRNAFSDGTGRGNIGAVIANEVNSDPVKFFDFVAREEISSDIDTYRFRTDADYRKTAIDDIIDKNGGVTKPSDDPVISQTDDLSNSYGAINRDIHKRATAEIDRWIDEDGNIKQDAIVAAGTQGLDPDEFIWHRVDSVVRYEFNEIPGLRTGLNAEGGEAPGEPETLYSRAVDNHFKTKRMEKYKNDPTALNNEIKAALFNDPDLWRDVDNDGYKRALVQKDFRTGIWDDMRRMAIEFGVDSLVSMLDEYVDEAMKVWSRDDAKKNAEEFVERHNTKWTDLSLEIQNALTDKFLAHGRFDVDQYWYESIFSTEDEDITELYPEFADQDLAERDEALKATFGIGMDPAQIGFGDDILDFVNTGMGRDTFQNTRAKPQQAILNYASEQGMLHEDMSMDYYTHFVNEVLPLLKMRAENSDAENIEEFNEDLEKFFADLGPVDTDSTFYDRQMDSSQVPMPTEEEIAAEPDLAMFGGIYGPGARPTERPKPAEPVDMTAMNEAIRAVGEGRPEFSQFLQQQASSDEFKKAWSEATAPIFDTEAYEEATSFDASDRELGRVPIGEAATEAQRIGQEAYEPSIRARTEATAARKALEGITDTSERVRQEFQVKERETIAGKLEGLVKEGFIEGEHRRGIKADLRDRFTTQTDITPEDFLRTRLPGFEESYRESPEAAAFRKTEETRMRSRLRVGRGGRGRALSVFQRGRR